MQLTLAYRAALQRANRHNSELIARPIGQVTSDAFLQYVGTVQSILDCLQRPEYCKKQGRAETCERPLHPEWHDSVLHIAFERFECAAKTFARVEKYMESEICCDCEQPTYPATVGNFIDQTGSRGVQANSFDCLVKTIHFHTFPVFDCSAASVAQARAA